VSSRDLAALLVLELQQGGDDASGQATLAFDDDENEAVLDAASEPGWWESAYEGGPPVGPSKLVRPLYFPGNPAGKGASARGPDVLAVKRAVWRGGRWEGPASRFDDVYSKGFALGVGGNVVETGLAGFQRQMRLSATGQMGDETYQSLRYARVPDSFPHGGEPLFDAYAVELLEQAAADPPGLGDADDVRSAIESYCRQCIANEPGWHYVQQRPMESLGRSPQSGGYSDCSEHSTAAYYWARKQTGIAVPDPNGRGFDGYGYTGTLINNPTAAAPYQIGDLALYGSSPSATSHVCTCYQPGSAGSSLWCSHGSEEAPYSVPLMYRADLIRVVRPKVVP
jgi:hypothetical protein